MKIRTAQLVFVFLLGMLIFTPLCMAKEWSYNYIVAYSLREQIVYYVPPFKLKVDGESYSNEEYVSDTETILKMEGNFQDFLEKKMEINTRDLTVSARVAYKTIDIAKFKMEKELGDFRFRGFAINEVKGFKYSD